MQKEEQVLVGKSTFYIKQMTAAKAVEHGFELAELLNKIKDTEVSGDESEDKMSSIVFMMSKMEPTKFTNLAKKLLDNNNLVLDEKRQPIHIDDIFYADDILDLALLLAKVLAVNYRSFFLKLVSGELGKLAEEIGGYLKA